MDEYPVSDGWSRDKKRGSSRRGGGGGGRGGGGGGGGVGGGLAQVPRGPLFTGSDITDQRGSITFVFCPDGLG